MTQDERDKKKKKKESILEAEIMALIQRSLDVAIKKSMDEIFKDWK